MNQKQDSIISLESSIIARIINTHSYKIPEKLACNYL